jgi:proteasome lid subunit RPN8/RPN11
MADDREPDQEITLGAPGGSAGQRFGRPPADARPPEVVITEAVRDQIEAHVSGDTSVERGGVLVGTVDRSTGRVTVSGAVPATTAVGQVASLTFTHETWDEVDREMAAHFGDLEIIGWYHSHPRFGIFLSSHDLFIHENFFSQPWQIAYVVDPIGHNSGFFGWETGQVARLHRWTVLGANDTAVGTPVRRPAADLPPSPLAGPATTRRRFPPSLGVLLAAIGLLVGAVAGYLIGDAHSTPAATAAPVASAPVDVIGIPGELMVNRSWVTTPSVTLAVVSVALRPGAYETGTRLVDAQVTSCAPTPYVSNPTVTVIGPKAAKLSAIIRTGQSPGSTDVARLMGSDSTLTTTATTDPPVTTTLPTTLPSTVAPTDPITAVTDPPTATEPSTYEPKSATTEPSANRYPPPITPTTPVTSVPAPITTLTVGAKCSFMGVLSPGISLVDVLADPSPGDTEGGASWQPETPARWVPLPLSAVPEG